MTRLVRTPEDIRREARRELAREILAKWPADDVNGRPATDNDDGNVVSCAGGLWSAALAIVEREAAR